ncbi:MAG: helix-turn-helix domain-containing protein [Acidaminococcaceae bacterium]|nr:helix-turn-helix domain-containing protein [Acidaminococcaceae bacterium]
MVDEKIIAEKIKDTRLYLGFTQEEFGKLLGISKQSICSWEKGRNMPDILNLLKIVKISGKYFSEFLDKETSTDKNDNVKIVLNPNEEQLIYKLRSLPSKQQQSIETIIKAM